MAAYEARKTANSLRSGAECQDMGGMCEDDMEQQQHASLPSLGRFEARYKYNPFHHCPVHFEFHLLPTRHSSRNSIQGSFMLLTFR